MNKLIIIAIIVIPIIYSLLTQNQKGTNFIGRDLPGEAEFIYDVTYEKNGERIHEHNIFKREMELISQAKEFILLDLFLYNDEYNRDEMTFPNQVEQMTDLLIKKKSENKNMPVILITDPLNNFYGAYTQRNIKRLMDSGVEVIVADINKIKDSNPFYSGFYRIFLKWLGVGKGGSIPNIFEREGEKVGVRAFLKLLNFKANHRKVLITEEKAIVASANPHDPSAYHGNVALEMKGEVLEDLIQSEIIFLEKAPEVILNFKSEKKNTGDITLKVRTEIEILNGILENLDRTQKGDEVDIGIFYISDFKVLRSIENAINRGVNIRIIADQNKDAFGLEKMGTPNRPALSELSERHSSLQIKWYNTTGEQFHTKMMHFKFKSEDPVVILGSANFTKRNLRNLNLETDIELKMPKDSKLNRDIENYFERIWNNIDGLYTVDLNEHFESNLFIRILWKFQEFTGLCTW